ncbi:MAG: cytochrome-c peroxidase [Taibaiella sp.]|nr:cytochrome-c peroxidase [Taibaiella sp.]
MKKIMLAAGIVSTVFFCSSFFSAPAPDNALSFKGAPSTKEQLGEVLFFEKKLSLDGTVSCASCHIPAHGFADTLPLSHGVFGRTGKRNSPSCANVSGRPYLFYDGRAATLEAQVSFPIEDHSEMGIPFTKALSRIAADKFYISCFKKIFNSKPTAENLRISIAAFERSLETSKTPFDRYMDGADSAISAAAIRGRAIFMGTKSKCFDCHFSPDFTGDEFRNIGLFDGGKLNDSGRYLISHNKEDIGKFKVPGLRNVAVTAPYMHNGMFKTLREVIEYYDDPYRFVPNPVNSDSLLLHPLRLTENEKSDLEVFLLTLTDDRFTKNLKRAN